MIFRLTAISFLIAGAVAKACSCARVPTTCELLASAKVAFIGTVKQGTAPDAPGAEKRPGAGFGAGGRLAIVSIETMVRGLPADTLEIQVNPMLGTSCYMEMKAGERWLIFGGVGGTNPEVVMTGGCTGSTRIPPTDPHRINRMVASYQATQQQPSSPVPNFVFGDVRIYKGWDTQWRNDNFVADAEVELVPVASTTNSTHGAANSEPTPGRKPWSAKTGTSGKFEVEGLDPGAYRLSVKKDSLGAELQPRDAFRDFGESLPVQVQVPTNGCMELSVVLRPETRISGTVRSAAVDNWKPVPQVKVTAFELDQSHGRRQSVRSAVTDDRGRYEITRIPAGTYVVGVNAERGEDSLNYPTTFHPSAASQHGATRVELVESNPNPTAPSRMVADGIDIALPASRRAVSVRVQVVWPDGRPAENAMLRIEHPENGGIYSVGRSTNGLDNRLDGFTGVGGYTTVQLYEGTEYTVSAVWQKIERQSPVTGTAGAVAPRFPGRTLAWHLTDRLKVTAAPQAEVRLTLSDQPDDMTFRR
jgi:hypothetical protein